MADKAAIIRALMVLDSNAEDVVKHYGVMGMHWGVRTRGRGSSGGVKKTPTNPPRATKPTEEKKLKPLTDHERAMILRSRGTKNLTTAELKELTTRMQLEKTYQQMQPAGRLKRAETALTRTVNLVGTVERAYALANSPMGKKIQQQVQEQLKHTPKKVAR